MTQTYKVQVSMNNAHIVESGFVWKQGDFGFNIEIEVLDFDTTGATPQIIFRKSTGAVEATQISVAGNKFTYAIRGTELDTPGPCVCDLKLNDSTTKRVSTASFKYFVIPDTMDGLEEEASSYSDTIEQLLEDVVHLSDTPGLVKNDGTINTTIEAEVAKTTGSFNADILSTVKGVKNITGGLSPVDFTGSLKIVNGGISSSGVGNAITIDDGGSNLTKRARTDLTGIPIDGMSQLLIYFAYSTYYFTAYYVDDSNILKGSTAFLTRGLADILYNKPEGATKIILQFARQNNNAFTPSEIYNNFRFVYLNKTGITDNIPNNFIWKDIEWENGSISAAGAETSATDRIRTGFVEFPKGSKVTIIPPYGTVATLFAFDENQNVIENYTTHNNVMWYGSSKYSFISGFAYFRIVISYNENANISPAYGNLMAIYYEMPSIEKALQIESNECGYHIIDSENWAYGTLTGPNYPPTIAPNDPSRIRTKLLHVSANTIIHLTDQDHSIVVYGSLFGRTPDWQTVDFNVPAEQDIYILVRKNTNTKIENEEFIEACNSVVLLDNKSVLKNNCVKTIQSKDSILASDFYRGSLTGSSYPYTANYSADTIRSIEFYAEAGTVIDAGTNYVIALCGRNRFTPLTRSVLIEESQTFNLIMRKVPSATIAPTDIPTMVAALTVTQNNAFNIDYQTEIHDIKASISDTYTSGRLSYAMITDLHIDGQDARQPDSIERQLRALVDIVNKSDIDFVAVGGDLIIGGVNTPTYTSALDRIRQITGILASSTKPVFMVKGNHDSNSFDGHGSSRLLTDNMFYANCIGMFPTKGVHPADKPDSLYYYYDFPEKKTRCIFLDASDWDGEPGLLQPSYIGFTHKQLKWLLFDALNKPDSGWQYIIFAHTTPEMEYTCYETVPNNSDELIGIIGALNNRTTYAGMEVTKDFSEYNSQIKIYHYGHIHCDLMINDETLKLMYICTRCACCYINGHSLDDLHVDSDEYTPPAAGTYGWLNEAAFDVVSVTETGVTAYRFGNGIDRTLNFEA